MYKVQLVQKFQPNDQPRRKAFAVDMINRTNEDTTLFSLICSMLVAEQISGESWARKSPCGPREHERDSPKVNVRPGLVEDRVVGPSSSLNQPLLGVMYLDMLEQFVIPQLQYIQDIIFQKMERLRTDLWMRAGL